jgi:hypothetical protein
MSLWALMIGKFNEPFMMHLVDKAEFYLLNKNKIKNKLSKVCIFNLICFIIRLIFIILF